MNLKSPERRAYLTATLNAALLAACGGGGGGGSAPPAAPPAPPPEAAKAWQTPEQLEALNSGPASPPQMAVDAQGNALAVWSQANSERTRVLASRYTPAGGWSAAEQINDNNAIALSFAPRVAVNSQGEAVAVWAQLSLELGVTKASLRANHFTPGAGWSGPVRAGEQTPLTGFVSQPQIALDDSGVALVVRQQFGDVIDNPGADQPIFASRYTPQGGWDNAVVVSTASSFKGNAEPQVAFDDKGSAFAVWVHAEDPDNGFFTLLVRRFERASGEWVDAPEVLAPISLDEIGSDKPANTVSPQIALNASGQAVVLWRDQVPPSASSSVRVLITGMWAAHFDGAKWSAPQTIEKINSGGEQGFGQVAMDASGNALAVWWRKRLDVVSILASRFDGTAWSAVEELDLGSATHVPQQPQIAIDASGNGMAVWSVFNGEPQRVNQRSKMHARNFTPASGWGAPERLDNGTTGDAVAPQVAFGPDGGALAVWRQSDGPISVPASPVFVWANEFR